MSWYDKRNEIVYTVREVELSTYDSFTSSKETEAIYKSLKDALEYAAWCADSFEEAYGGKIFGESVSVRLADEPMFKVIFVREFGKFSGCHELRVLVTKREA